MSATPSVAPAQKPAKIDSEDEDIVSDGSEDSGDEAAHESGMSAADDDDDVENDGELLNGAEDPTDDVVEPEPKRAKPVEEAGEMVQAAAE